MRLFSNPVQARALGFQAPWRQFRGLSVVVMRVLGPSVKMSRSRSLGEGFRVGQNVCVLDCSFLGTCWATAARSLALSTE